MRILLVCFVALLRQDDPAALIQQLGAGEIESRDAAQRKLEALGVKARDPLKKALATAKDDLKARLQAVLDKLPKLEMTLKTVEKPKAGASVELQVRLKNVSDDPLVLVGSLDGSDGRRFPYVVIDIKDADGKAVPWENGKGCGYKNSMREKDFVEVKPGAEFDPFQTIDSGGFFGNPKCGWAPPKAGTYSITVTYDSTPTDYDAWKGSGEGEKGVAALWARVCHAKVVKTIEVKVE